MAKTIYENEFDAFQSPTKERIKNRLCSDGKWNEYKNQNKIERAKPGERDGWETEQEKIVEQYTTVLNVELISYAVDFGYDDAKRTFKNISKVNKVEKQKAFDTIKARIKEYFENCKNYPDFDSFTGWHNDCCAEFENALKVGGKSIICRGQSQKVLNMAFKYLFCFATPDEQEYFKFCHMALDSYILDWYKRQINNDFDSNKKWSSLKEEDYKNIEKEIYGQLTNGQVKYLKHNDTNSGIPLESMMIKSEFIIWAYEVAYEQWMAVKTGLETFKMNKIKSDHLSDADRDAIKDLITECKNKI